MGMNTKDSIITNKDSAMSNTKESTITDQDNAVSNTNNSIVKWGVRILFFIALLLIAKFVIIPKMQARKAVPPPVAVRPIIVKTIRISPQTFEFTRNYTARVTDDSRTTVSARLSSTVKKVYFREGDMVRAGDILVILDTQDIRSEVNRSEASVAKIQADIEFFEQQIIIDRKLYQGGAISKTALDDSERKLKALRASLAQQKSGLRLSHQKFGYGKIYAPISGRIQKLYVSKGEQTAPGKPVIDIVGGANYKAVIAVSERDMGNMSVGNTVYIKIPGGDFWKGKINKIYPALDERTHTGTVDVKLGNEISKKFFAGSTTNARIVTAQYENALAIPSQSIFYRNGINGVFTVRDKTAHWKPVTLGADNGLQTIIESGLAIGEQVIITPYPSLNEGVKVRMSEGAAQ